MNLLEILVVASSVTLAGAAVNAAPAKGSDATTCVPQQINAAPPGKGGWPAATNAKTYCETLTTAACAKPETIAGFNGKYGFRVPATAGADCSVKTLTAR
jgi:hypothetical protein